MSVVLSCVTGSRSRSKPGRSACLSNTHRSRWPSPGNLLAGCLSRPCSRYLLWFSCSCRPPALSFCVLGRSSVQTAGIPWWSTQDGQTVVPGMQESLEPGSCCCEIRNQVPHLQLQICIELTVLQIINRAVVSLFLRTPSYSILDWIHFTSLTFVEWHFCSTADEPSAHIGRHIVLGCFCVVINSCPNEKKSVQETFWEKL